MWRPGLLKSRYWSHIPASSPWVNVWPSIPTLSTKPIRSERSRRLKSKLAGVAESGFWEGSRDCWLWIGSMAGWGIGLRSWDDRILGADSLDNLGFFFCTCFSSSSNKREREVRGPTWTPTSSRRLAWSCGSSVGWPGRWTRQKDVSVSAISIRFVVP